MPRLFARVSLSALALLCAASGLNAGADNHSGSAGDSGKSHERVAVAGSGFDLWSAFSPLRIFRERQVANQVRIEQRVVVRISPQPVSARRELAARALERELVTRYREKRIGKCIPLEGIAAVQPGSGNRLVLFLHDDRLLSLNLDKSCRARDFYSGFYVERHKDGRLCVDRDRLQSRTGAKCEVERLHQLIEVAE
jgi:hypothetical protein